MKRTSLRRIRGWRFGPVVFLAPVVPLSLGAAGRLAAQTIPTEDQCVTCHLTLDEDRLRAPAELFPEDVHGARGFDCLSCHGRVEEGPGGLDAAAGFLARPTRSEIPGLCGRCHSDAAFMRDYDPGLRVDQVAEYLTSGHGLALLASGDPDVATCVSCHPAHRILPPDDPNSTVYPLNVADLCGGCHSDPEVMGDHPQGTAQLRDYRASVHGRLMYEEQDLSAPTCNDCHGNHGAAPPGLASVRNVCGQCHSMMADFFAGSGHPEFFEEEGLPGCATCHDHHAIEATSDDFLDERSRSVCSTCHAPEDPAGDAFLVMKVLIDSLEAEAAQSRAVLLEAENLGMEVEQALFDLDEVSNALVKARTAVHAFQIDPVRQEIEAGLQTTATVRERGEGALFEHWFRRAGLAASAAVILSLILALVLKIRHIDQRLEELVSSLEAFFRESVLEAHREGGKVGAEAIRLAACALLLELAYADDEFTRAELLHLEDLVQRRFGLEVDDARKLIELARSERERGADLHEFTRLVAQHFSPAEKRDLLNAMWGLVLSDGELEEHERQLMAELTEQLGMVDDAHARSRSGPVRRWMRMFFGAMGRRWEGSDEAVEDVHLAACALLVELVHADDDFSEVERAHLERLLGDRFGLTGAQAERLIRLTEAHRAEGVDLREMIGVIGMHYSRAEKQALVDAMWSLVLADGVLARKERDLMGRIIDLLGLDVDWATSTGPGDEGSATGGST